MKKALNKFSIVFILLTLVCQGLIWFVYEPVTGLRPSVLFQTSPSFLLILNLLVHYYLLRTVKNAPKKFVTAFMGLTSAKMMISLIFAAIMAFTTRPDFKEPVVAFALFYLLFMGLEVVFIIQDIARLNDKS
jgi:hypothetical protein